MIWVPGSTISLYKVYLGGKKISHAPLSAHENFWILGPGNSLVEGPHRKNLDQKLGTAMFCIHLVSTNHCEIRPKTSHSLGKRSSWKLAMPIRFEECSVGTTRIAYTSNRRRTNGIQALRICTTTCSKPIGMQDLMEILIIRNILWCINT